MTGPWKWTALPGLGTPDGMVYALTKTGGYWILPPAEPLPRTWWLTSERRPEPPHDPPVRR